MYCHAQLMAVRCSPETSAKSKEQSHMGQAEAPAYALGTMPTTQYHKAKVTEHEKQRDNYRPCRGGRFTLQAKDYANNRHQDHAFGGYKMSGYGREGISATLEELSQVKTIFLKNVW